MDFVSKFVNVHRIVLQIKPLFLIYGDHQFFFRDFTDNLCFGHIDFDAGLDYGRGHHEDDQQDEDDIDEGNHIDFRQRRLSLSLARRDRH